MPFFPLFFNYAQMKCAMRLPRRTSADAFRNKMLTHPFSASERVLAENMRVLIALAENCTSQFNKPPISTFPILCSVQFEGSDLGCIDAMKNPSTMAY